MLKLGVCSPSQIDSPARFWRRGPLSARMLSSAGAALFDRIMTDICLSNNTARTTSNHRFSNLHTEIAPVIRSLFPVSGPLLVEDWAISSGVTAAAWFQALHRDYPQLQFAGSDWMLSLIEAYRRDTNQTYILEPDGTPIQYIRPPFVVQLARTMHPIYVFNRHLRQQALEIWNTQFRDTLRIPSTLPESPATPLGVPPFELRSLPLIHPDVLSLRSQNFKIRQHSVFEPAPQPVHIVRTMNILNRAYFGETQLREAAAAVASSLLPGGLWIVGRTVSEAPPAHEVSLLQSVEGRWKVLHRTGKGSEIEPLLHL